MLVDLDPTSEALIEQLDNTRQTMGMGVIRIQSTKNRRVWVVGKPHTSRLPFGVRATPFNHSNFGPLGSLNDLANPLHPSGSLG
jgi:hypothetical protein